MESRAVTLHGPVVVLPEAEYRLLLAEAGHLPTPRLARRIRTARRRWKRGRYHTWEQVKRALR